MNHISNSYKLNYLWGELYNECRIRTVLNILGRYFVIEEIFVKSDIAHFKTLKKTIEHAQRLIIPLQNSQ